MDEPASGLLDAGVNLASSQFSKDLPDVIERAQAAQVEALVAIGTCLESSGQCTRLAEQYAGYVFATVGIHPHNADQFDEHSRQQLLRLVDQPAVVAVGETGLDFNRNFSTPDNQRKAFAAQLEIAGLSNKPVYLHERDAFQAQVDILTHYRASLTGGLAHCFTGSTDQLRVYLDLGFHIGITGWICDPRRGGSLRDAVAFIPRDRLILETDAPYLIPRHLDKKQLPVPKRRRNEPCLLPAIAQFVAELLDWPVAQLARQSGNNARKLFKLAP